jgi:DOPA 4,5-dioxygenase
MTDQPAPVSAIRDWHAHVYYDDATRAQAATLRGWVEDAFTVRMGRWHDVPVGPHPQAMYQIAFANEVFPTLAPFLALNRGGLAVLIHPDTGRPRDDHAHHAIWLGAVLPLNTAMLPEISAPE